MDEFDSLDDDFPKGRPKKDLLEGPGDPEWCVCGVEFDSDRPVSSWCFP